MKPPTLHRLLWGPVPDSNTNITDWCIRTWEVPAVGLPARVATFLFLAAQKGDLPPDWNSVQYPLTWQLNGCDELLSVGRRFQFGTEIPAAQSGAEQPKVRRTTAWEVKPHEAYFLPFVAAAKPCGVHRDGYALYCDILLLLTAMDGGEAILDRLAKDGPGVVPFEDRWAWRSRIHLPMEAWRQIERAFRWSEAPSQDVPEIRKSLVQELEHWSPQKLTLEDFDLERVDLRLETKSDVEVVRAVRPLNSEDGDLPKELQLDVNGKQLQASLIIRIGQISKWPSKKQVVERFPAVDSDSANHIMEQVAGVFQSPSHAHGSDDGHGCQRSQIPELVLLPEVSVPQSEVRVVRDLVASTGRASLAGLYWRELTPVYRASGSTSAARKWFVNEAELVLPVGHGNRGPTSVRWYRVRKPIPAHIETGLARELTNRSQGTCWGILRGQRWYRFVHPRWGDFTIAICADLLDTAPWRSLRGEILHLFMVAFNKDVDLYDSLTWVRAYENYVNLVAVNHGRFGGSFIWTPRSRQGRELARLRGGELFLIADVDVPVKDLLKEQRSGVQDAVDSATRSWAECKDQSGDFKSPHTGV